MDPVARDDLSEAAVFFDAAVDEGGAAVAGAAVLAAADVVSAAVGAGVVVSLAVDSAAVSVGGGLVDPFGAVLWAPAVSLGFDERPGLSRLWRRLVGEELGGAVSVFSDMIRLVAT